MRQGGGYLDAFADSDEQRLEAHYSFVMNRIKPLRTMATQELDAAIYWIREVSEKRQLKDKLLESTPDHDVWLRYKPLGVVGGNHPWNFPVLAELMGRWRLADHR